MIGDSMIFNATTYIIICIFIIYLFYVFNVHSFRLNSIDLKKSIELKICQLIKGVVVLGGTITPWGYTLWGRRVFVIIFLVAILGDIYYKNKAVKEVSDLSIHDKEHLCSSAKMLYIYSIPFVLVCLFMIFAMDF